MISLSNCQGEGKGGIIIQVDNIGTTDKSADKWRGKQLKLEIVEDSDKDKYRRYMIESRRWKMMR